MLARATRRKLRRDAFLPQPRLAEQLTLPWLCPAQMRWTATTGTASTRASSESRPQTHSWRKTTSLSPRSESRALATAADIQSSHTSSLYTHFSDAWRPIAPNPELSKLPQWNVQKPLVVHEATATPVPTTPINRGIGGDPIELHQNLYACLRVGRMDRATAILQRLARLYEPFAPELVDAHNIYLKTMFDQASMNPTEDAMDEIEGWYKRNMVDAAIEPNVQTLVTLLRAAFTFLQGAEKEDFIRKYLDIAQVCGPSVLDGVNASADFSDEEWDFLIRFQPEVFDEPPSVEEVQHIQLSTPGGHKLAIEHGLVTDPSLAIKAVSQKGLGLQTLQASLHTLNSTQEVPYPHELPGTKEEKDRAYAYMRQIRLEEDGTKAAIERWEAEDAKLQELGIFGVLQSKPIQALMWQWYSTLLPRLREEIKKTKEVLSSADKGNVTDPCHTYGPWLEQCEPEKLAAVAISRVLSGGANRETNDRNMLKISSLAIGIGRCAEEEVNSSITERFQRYLSKVRRRARQDLLGKISKNNRNYSHGELLQLNKVNDPELDTFRKQDFPTSVKTKIGAIVLEHLIQSAMITVSREDPKTGKTVTSTQRAFHHHTGFLGGKRIGWIQPHHEIEEKLRNNSIQSVQHVKLPMLVEPKPWVGFSEGGYFTQKEQAVRTKAGDNEQKSYAHSAIENGDLEQMLQGLDVLGKVPWNVNADVLRVMAQAWNTGEDVGGLIPEVCNLERPADPPADAPYQERAKWAKAMKEYNNAKNGLHSERCFQNFQLEVARAFAKEKFYYPHSVDFRGRAYPVPPVLNHIGADLARGLLKFANGKELGAVGLRWMKIHLANLYGYDKASLRDREQFAMDHVNDIYDSATNPLDGQRWWAKAEDPWQCLACCMELKNALDSPDPTRFVSHLPVHQDGTCNGLQHYAALGGDYAGATQVNLEPSDRPQDIYTGVAELVKDMIAKDAAKGIATATFMNGKVTRKVVKRTVMTNVYGVTFMGAKLQVLDELKHMFPNFQPTDQVRGLHYVAMYVAKKIFVALGEIFNGAQEIQYWLGECGARITTSLSPEQIRQTQERINGKEPSFDPKYKAQAKLKSRHKQKLLEGATAFRTSIIWTTPLKMPVVQPYRKHPKEQIKCRIQNITVTKRSAAEPVDKRKQLQAFPPNFIHSLDATHMILSALKCHELGLDFAAVHDSFWTHAADIPNLNVVLRDAFVRMHSEDVVGRLAAEFTARYAGHMYAANLFTNSPVAQQILEWRKSYEKLLPPGRRNTSEATAGELALEQTRQDLLKSENELDRKKGEEMVTPTSIWLANQDPAALTSYRLALLGETNRPRAKKLDDAKDHVSLTEAQAVATEESSAHISLDDEASMEDHDLAEEQVAAAEEVTTSASPRDNKGIVRVWIPIEFPPVPKKGSWDVQRLKQSEYFFS